MATIDHIIPTSKGGLNAPENFLVFCYKCNSARGNDNFLEWIRKMKYPKQKWLKHKYDEAVELHKQRSMA